MSSVAWIDDSDHFHLNMYSQWILAAALGLTVLAAFIGVGYSLSCTGANGTEQCAPGATMCLTPDGGLSVCKTKKECEEAARNEPGTTCVSAEAGAVEASIINLLGALLFYFLAV